MVGARLQEGGHAPHRRRGRRLVGVRVVRAQPQQHVARLNGSPGRRAPPGPRRASVSAARAALPPQWHRATQLPQLAESVVAEHAASEPRGTAARAAEVAAAERLEQRSARAGRSAAKYDEALLVDVPAFSAIALPCD